MIAIDSKERFSNRVENYVRYRPGYPKLVLETLREECGLAPDSVVADIGSGTGILTRLFLENGNEVYGVEPNARMREAGEKYLKSFPHFRSVKWDGRIHNLGVQERGFCRCGPGVSLVQRAEGARGVRTHS